MLRLQGGQCAICRRKPKRLVIDHYHAVGFKAMGAIDRKQYVRGLLCDRENHWIVGKYATVEILRASADYLERFEQRRKEDAIRD